MGMSVCVCVCVQFVHVMGVHAHVCENESECVYEGVYVCKCANVRVCM